MTGKKMLERQNGFFQPNLLYAMPGLDGLFMNGSPAYRPGSSG